MRTTPARIALGVLITLAGVVFTLQGVNTLHGSSMSNSTTWAVLGPIIALVGLVVMASGLRRRR